MSVIVVFTGQTAGAVKKSYFGHAAPLFEKEKRICGSVTYCNLYRLGFAAYPSALHCSSHYLSGTYTDRCGGTFSGVKRCIYEAKLAVRHETTVPHSNFYMQTLLTLCFEQYLESTVLEAFEEHY